ncbi:MAG TPA: glycosyl hydrolase [Thermoanaerobaculia bacterium]|nr:glycosyl hydrolase [Thermoanaerobaculia bacterium]
MKAGKRYQFAFFALGWLIAIGLLFQIGLGAGFRSAYNALGDRIINLAQRFSDVEGNVVTSVRRSSRRDYLAPLRPTLASVTALRNPAMMLFGVYDGGFPNTFAGMEKFETDLDYKFPIISFYVAWGDKPTEQFPTRMVDTINRMGSVPMITWEPWVVDFDERLRPNLPRVAEREYACLAAIARGDYDFYVVAWAKAAAAYGKPMFLRFAHEMNDPYRYPWGPQNGNRPEDFIAAWKHVHLIFQKMGADNVLWVWSPHISMPWFEYYYPGLEFVDWVGIGVLNYGNVASWSRWWSFQQILEKAYPGLLALKKPIMICEFGTLTKGGNAYEWYRQAFYHIDHTFRRGIRGLVLFNQEDDNTMTALALNWSVEQDPAARAFVAQQLARHSAM